MMTEGWRFSEFTFKGDGGEGMLPQVRVRLGSLLGAFSVGKSQLDLLLPNREVAVCLHKANAADSTSPTSWAEIVEELEVLGKALLEAAAFVKKVTKVDV